MKNIFIVIFSLTVFTSCSFSSNNSESSEDNDAGYVAPLYNGTSTQDIGTLYSDDDDESSQFEDGTYSATVEYYNPDTGFSNTYTLDVEVEDGMLVQINFPNGGWLDSSHMDPPELDENGCCTVETYDGKTYEVSLDL